MPTTEQGFAATVAVPDAGWTNGANVLDFDDDVAAVKTGATIKNFEVNTFNFLSTIPEGATIKKVVLKWRYMVDTTAGNGIFGTQIKIEPSTFVWDYAASEAQPEPTSLTTFEKDITELRAWTRADFENSKFKYRFRVRNNGGAETTFSVAWVRVYVTWETLAVASIRTRVGGLWVAAKRKIKVPASGGGGATQTLLHADSMASTDFEADWGSYQAASKARYELITSGGDLRPMGNGEAQPNVNFRRLILLSADVANVGNERTELGANTRTNGSEGGAGTFMVYPESTDEIETWFSLRLPESFPLSDANWQVVMQMKQAQPYVGDNEGHVILEMEARQNQFQIITPWNTESNPLWTCPATKSRWIRFRWVVVYHHASATGRIRLQVDDRAGASDWVVQRDSGLINYQTLATSSGNGSGLVTGQAIPSHLRLGIYRNPVINVDTSIDIDNVQVYKLTSGGGGGGPPTYEWVEA